MRRYHGRVQFVPAPVYESFGEALQHNNDCKAAIGISGLGQGNDAPVQQGGIKVSR
jgi:hypothetical protein